MGSTKQKIYLNRIVLIFAYIIINILMLLLLYGKDIKMITVITIIQLILNIYFMNLFRVKLFSLAGIFIVFSYIFHFGHLILITFNIEADRPFDVINMVSSQVFIKSIYFVYLSQMFLVIGILISNLFKNKAIKVNCRNNNEDIIIIKKIALILISIGILPNFYIDINKIILYLNGNYLDTYRVGIPGSLQIIANFTKYGFLMLLIAEKDNKNNAKIIFWISLLYQIIMMLTGNRANQILYIITLLFIYYNLIKKITFKNSLILFLSGYIGIVFINFISNIRMISVKDMHKLVIIFTESLTKLPIFDALGEFGSTLISVCYSIMFFPTLTSYSKGETYLFSFLATIPGISSIIPSIKSKFIFINNFPSSYRYALGGSYIGELYYNFGNFGVIFTLLIGVLIGSIGRTIDESIVSENWIKLSISIVLFPNVLFWIRNYFPEMIREILWTISLSLILYNFIKNKIRVTI